MEVKKLNGASAIPRSSSVLGRKPEVPMSAFPSPNARPKPTAQ
jgi:hypothetical protein